MRKAKLRIINSRLSGKEFVLPDHAVTVGRSSENDFAIPDQSVSRQHVRAEFDGENCVLTDLDSHNGIVLSGETLRRVMLREGDRFELGDVAIEFSTFPAEEAPAAGGPPSGDQDFSPVIPEGYALAEPNTLPSERPVLVDDLFGPGGVAKAEAGAEEEAAVSGARGAAKYLFVLLAIIGVGAVAWRLAGRGAPEENVKPVMVKAGEVKVIDLGINTRTRGGRVETYIDHREVYYEKHFEDGVAILDVEVTNSKRGVGFIAVVEGLDIGRETDVKLTGPGGRRCTVRILVRGEAPKRLKHERLSDADRTLLGERKIAGGRTALKTGHLYLALKRFREARELLEPVRSGEGGKLRREADEACRSADNALDEKFKDIKFQAVALFREKDDRGVARQIEKLRNLIPDSDDLRHKKLQIIFERTLDRIWRKGR